MEHNWWNNYQNGEYPPDETRTLGLDHELMDTGAGRKEYALLDAVKEKFGTPHYIRFGSLHEDEQGLDPKTALFKEVEREFDTSYEGIVGVFYDMIYDYGDILMVMYVHEQIVGANNITDLVYAEFWTRECWEHRKDIEPNYGGENDNEKMYEPYEGAPGNSGSQSTPENSSSEPEGSSSEPEQNDSPFWFARQTWTEAPRSEFEGGILRDNRKTLNLLKIDDLSAPFRSGLAPTDNWITDKFSDIWYNDVDISSIYYDEIETQYVGYGNEPLPYDGIGTIQVFNFDNIPHSVEDCLENGWWKTAVTDNRFLYETVALGLDSSLSRNDDDDVYEEELINAVIEKFGTPHYIYYPWGYKGSKNPDRRAAMYEDMESILNPVPGNEMHFIQYQFVYELENDLVMTVFISENRNTKDDFITLNVDYAEFWSGACWENRHAVMNMDIEMDEIELFTVYEP